MTEACPLYIRMSLCVKTTLPCSMANTEYGDHHERYVILMSTMTLDMCKYEANARLKYMVKQ